MFIGLRSDLVAQSHVRLGLPGPGLSSYTRKKRITGPLNPNTQF